MPFLPESASNFAHKVDPLFLTLFLLTVVFGGGVMFLAVYYAVKYRAGTPVHRKRPEHENKRLESVLLGGPLLLGLSVFIWGAKIYADQRTIPKNALEVFVMGKQWMWHIQHAEGAREMNRLTIPVGRPIQLTMVSQDVIHEFYVPAFRVQFQVIPGRYTFEWFTPTKIGRYTFLCNQYCGMDHSRMYGEVVVLSQDDYAKWLARQSRPGSPSRKPLVEAGRDLFQSKNCVSCHGATDTPLGPSLVGLFNSPARLEGGRTVPADENYLRRSIAKPGDEIAANYTNSMPAYPELDERDYWALVSYLRNLQRPEQLPVKKPRAPALEENP